MNPAEMAQMAADLDRLRAVWRAVVNRLGDLDMHDDAEVAALAAGLLEEVEYDPAKHGEVDDCVVGDIISVLTPDGARLAKES